MEQSEKKSANAEAMQIHNTARLRWFLSMCPNTINLASGQCIANLVALAFPTNYPQCKIIICQVATFPSFSVYISYENCGI